MFLFPFKPNFWAPRVISGSGWISSTVYRWVSKPDYLLPTSRWTVFRLPSNGWLPDMSAVSGSHTVEAEPRAVSQWSGPFSHCTRVPGVKHCVRKHHGADMRLDVESGLDEWMINHELWLLNTVFYKQSTRTVGTVCAEQRRPTINSDCRCYQVVEVPQWQGTRAGWDSPWEAEGFEHCGVVLVTHVMRWHTFAVLHGRLHSLSMGHWRVFTAGSPRMAVEDTAVTWVTRSMVMSYSVSVSMYWELCL